MCLVTVTEFDLIFALESLVSSMLLCGNEQLNTDRILLYIILFDVCIKNVGS